MLCECIEKKPSKLTPAEGEIMMRCCGIWAKSVHHRNKNTAKT